MRGNGRSIGVDASCRHAGFNHKRIESLAIQGVGNDKRQIPSNTHFSLARSPSLLQQNFFDSGCDGRTIDQT